MSSIDAMEIPALVHLHPDRRRPALAGGLGMMLLAVAAIAFPSETALVVGAAGGWLLWLAGALMLAVALVTFTSWLRVLGAVAALSAVGLGFYLTLHPAAGALATAMVLAAALVMDGSFQFAAALHLRPLSAWRWLLASAVTSLAAAGMLASSAPARSPQAVALLLFAAFATTGAALVATSLARAAPRREFD